jgi:transcriptional regulator with XRE-family HTH domain
VTELARSIAVIFDEQLRMRRISQQTAGDHIGVSQQQMSRYLRGERPLDVDEIQGLCDLLGLDFHQTMRDAQDRL